MKFTILKMEKHPIDELFAKKMAEYRQEPSQRAFEKFQARVAEREQEKRGGGFLSISHNRRWYYGAAAGLAIALSVVFLSQKEGKKDDFAQNQGKTNPVEIIQPKNTTEPIVKEQLANNSIPKTIEKQPIKVSIQKENIDKPIIENTISIAQNEPKESKENTIQNPIIDHTEVTESIATTVVIPEQNTDNQTVIPNETPVLKGIQPQNTVENVEEPVVLANNFQPIEEAELMPMIDEDSVTEFDKLRQAAMEREENSKSFLARLSDEYKHLKYGEKVDLNNLKVKPKDVLARADEQILREERNDIKETFYRKFSKILKIQ
jgi:hypothetical protein